MSLYTYCLHSSSFTVHDVLIWPAFLTPKRRRIKEYGQSIVSRGFHFPSLQRHCLPAPAIQISPKTQPQFLFPLQTDGSHITPALLIIPSIPDDIAAP